MKAIVQKPGESPETVALEGDTLKALQGLVGGYITTVYHEALEESGITAWAHDEGLLIGLTPNLVVYGQPIVGPVVFTGHNDEGETVGLTAEQEEIVHRFLAATDVLTDEQREVVAQRIAAML